MEVVQSEPAATELCCKESHLASRSDSGPVPLHDEAGEGLARWALGVGVGASQHEVPGTILTSIRLLEILEIACGRAEEKRNTRKTRTPNVGSALMSYVVFQCFVCGLVEDKIPVNSDCADAFAGDFLPLTPVNPLARSRTSSFRKYCRHGNL